MFTSRTTYASFNTPSCWKAPDLSCVVLVWRCWATRESYLLTLPVWISGDRLPQALADSALLGIYTLVETFRKENLVTVVQNAKDVKTPHSSLADVQALLQACVAGEE